MSDFTKTYTDHGWVDGSAPALSAGNMGDIDAFIVELDERTKELNSTKVDATTAYGYVQRAETASTEAQAAAEAAEAAAEAAAKTEVGALQTKVYDMDASGKMLGWTLPTSLQGKNYIDSDGVFHQTIDRIDLGSLTWQMADKGTTAQRFFTTGLKDLAKFADTRSDIATGFCRLYTMTTDVNLSSKTYTTDMVCALSNTTYFGVRNSNYSAIADFKSAMSGVYLYYELAEEVTMNVDGNELMMLVGKANDAFNALF